LVEYLLCKYEAQSLNFSPTKKKKKKKFRPEIHGKLPNERTTHISGCGKDTWQDERHENKKFKFIGEKIVGTLIRVTLGGATLS
jgi:hypothetical protein